jgi:hypothetical protein
VECSPIIVFVGPNNSGKSKILHEFQRFCASGQPDGGDKILSAIEFEEAPQAVAESRIASVTLTPSLNDVVDPGRVYIGKRGVKQHVARERLLKAVMSPSSDLIAFCKWFLSCNTIMLDGKSRIGLVQPQEGGDLQALPQSSFQQLFRDDAKRAELRRIVHEAFGVHLVIDPTHLGQLRLRLSPTPPRSPEVERGIHDEAVAFHRIADPIDVGSDGVKAFIGMMSEIVAGDPEVLLIDEPEAFLHPALSFVLGREISRAAGRSGKRVFASTHSPNFVMGCVQSGAPVTIVRLTYREGVATARVLSSADLLKLMRDPLLRSTNVLGGLFYEAVVVAESDSDRAFYQEINERLLHHSTDRGIKNCLFINAQNKQTVPRLLRPLRDLGIAAAGIVDIDVLKDGGATWTSMMDAAFVPALERDANAHLRAGAKNALEATGRDMKRHGGVELLNGADREAVENLLRRLAEYGLFVVPSGELESWLRPLGVMESKPGWLLKMFERMGSDPMDPEYVRPQGDDVWEFIHRVKEWVSNPARRGIPS